VVQIATQHGLTMQKHARLYLSLLILACGCNDLGSENHVCDPDSGQCECKQDVEGRVCDHCKQHHYGIHTGQGCTSCNCNPTGSLNLTCDDVTGKCYCKPGVEDVSTDKCDICQQNYFNFTEEGCL
jgi:hypothetical protein